MAVAWPGFLQDKLNVASFSYTPGNTVIKSQNDVGPVKRRRRATKSVDMISCSINIQYSDFQNFYDFWDIDLNGGATSFEFANPFTGVVEEYYMDEPPKISPMPSGGIWYNVTMSWERAL